MRMLPFALLALAPFAAAQDVPEPSPALPIEALADTRIFFQSNDALWTCDGNGRGARRWTPEGLRMRTAASLSPDGHRLVVPGRRRFDLVHANGTTIDLGTYSGHAFEPAWSPDGRTIAFGTNEHEIGKGGIWLVDDLDQPSAPRRFTAPDAYDDKPAFSPDGRWLALAACQSSEIVRGADTILVARTSRLEIVDRATGKRIVGCERQGEIDAIAWSPDGRHLAFEVDGELLVVPMAGGVPGPHRVLPAKPRRGGVLTWSPDSTTVLANRNVVPRKVGHDARCAEDALLLAPLHGETRQIDLPRDLYAAAFDPSGEWIVVTLGDRCLHRVHVATGETELLLAALGFWSPVWWCTP